VAVVAGVAVRPGVAVHIGVIRGSDVV